MTFGEKLQLLRKKNGLSQEQLASQLSVSRQAVSKWELDNSLPDTEKVVQISKIFSVSTNDLLCEDKVVDVAAAEKNTFEVKDQFHSRIKLNIFYLCGYDSCWDCYCNKL